MRLLYGYASDVGLVRSQNEDSFLAGPGLLAVCDGMGGARAGEVASETACRLLGDLRPGAVDHVVLDRAVREANREIIQKSLDDRSYAGMGTTMTAVVQTGPSSVLIGHVGDSRAYLLRRGRLRQLTDDHSLVAEMVRRGQLTPQQALIHPHRSIITRALGTEPEVQADLVPVDLEPGDRLLLCTDGLSGMVPDRDLAEVLARGDDPGEVAGNLVEAALQAGGEDNVTVVVALAQEADEAFPPEDGEVLAGPADRSTGLDESGTVPVAELPAEAATGDGPAAEAAAGPGALVPSAAGPVAAGAATAEAPSQGAAERRQTPLWRRPLLLAPLGGLVALLIIIAGVAVFNSSVYFVGTDEGRVALYNGLPYEVLGVQLYEVVEVSPAEYDEQADHLQARVDSHELVTKEEGQQFIRSLSSPGGAGEQDASPPSTAPGTTGSTTATTAGSSSAAGSGG